jgi:hypothetical protein
MRRPIFEVCFVLLLAAGLAAQQPPRETKAATIAEKTAGLEKMPGYFPLYWDAKAGKLWIEIDKWNTEFLYINSLPAGVGSNDIGLDRGQIGDTRIVRFERSGPKVLLVQPNYSYRAISDNAEERRAVEEAFAQSAIWGFQVEAEEGGRALVDATSFYLRDAHGVVGTLARSKQGTFRLDSSRCAFYLPHTRNLPRNTEVETTLTFAGDQPGRFLSEVAPSPDSVTVRQHHSFVQLPEPGYQPRAFDPRAGYFGITYMDFATPINEPIVRRFIARHRLKKKHPEAAISEPVEPIIYYLDPGAPEPIRSALLEGARWWNQAFEAAGYKDAFQVRMLPQGADPMDVRYNLIQWVHRSTRGWSYGASIEDPRTGEIIKGQVTLGSLRVRQDYLIAEGLLAPYEQGRPVSPAMLEMALARLRQLSAHEVGHTLGLAHNFAASASNRASVMDYPHPLVKLPEAGAPDLGAAYATGVGEWDKAAIAYGYSDFPAGADGKPKLDAILAGAQARGLIFISDADARAPGGAHPAAHLWDNGANAVDELQRVMQVRARALARFSADNIREGAPMSTLEDVLVPVYLLHRYQAEAASKVLGGLYYTYALRGDGQRVTEKISGAEQRRAFDALLATIQPEALALPERLLRLIPPPAFGYRRSREDFAARTGPTFDPLAAAECAANLTVGLVLHPERAARLVEHHARDHSQPGLGEVIDKLLAATWKARAEAGYPGEIRRAVDQVVLYHLMALVANDSAGTQVRALASLKLDQLKKWVTEQAKITVNEGQRAHFSFAAAQISAFQRDPRQINLPKPAEPPPGQPIGMN